MGIKFRKDKNMKTSSKKNYQEEYRKYFGIKDKYLIDYEMGNENHETGFIVYIDENGDIRYVDFSKTNDQFKKDRWIAKLKELQAKSIANISKDNKVTYKKMLGSA